MLALAHAYTHTEQMDIYTIGQWNLPAKSIHPLMSHNSPWFPPAIPASPSHCAFRHLKGDYTGAKILRDQLINAIFKARIYMSRALNRPSDQHCLLFHTQFDLHIQQQINFCSFHLVNKKTNYHSKEQRLPHLTSMHTKGLHFNGSGKDRGSCLLWKGVEPLLLTNRLTQSFFNSLHSQILNTITLQWFPVVRTLLINRHLDKVVYRVQDWKKKHIDICIELFCTQSCIGTNTCRDTQLIVLWHTILQHMLPPPSRVSLSLLPSFVFIPF